jgi:hypothetical protein
MGGEDKPVPIRFGFRFSELHREPVHFHRFGFGELHVIPTGGPRNDRHCLGKRKRRLTRTREQQRENFYDRAFASADADEGAGEDSSACFLQWLCRAESSCENAPALAETQRPQHRSRAALIDPQFAPRPRCGDCDHAMADPSLAASRVDRCRAIAHGQPSSSRTRVALKL